MSGLWEAIGAYLASRRMSWGDLLTVAGVMALGLWFIVLAKAWRAELRLEREMQERNNAAFSGHSRLYVVLGMWFIGFLFALGFLLYVGGFVFLLLALV